jgi:metal-dependent hydrolase (beta-lactamase superfamily II)/glutamine amidotransferase-like uncharacterized protein/WD40 repeat protein
VRTKESGWGIYLINADGSREKRILGHAEALAYPEWSPDGSQIIFHKHQSDEVWSINVMDADGSNERRLTDTDTQDAAPVWSPDGSKIAFTRNEDIWVMNADGSDARLLMDDPVAANGAEWSPDGSQIVFESGRHGNTEIYVMDSNGSNLQRLTNNEAEDWWPTWSPDGSQIAFMSTLNDNWDIYIMNANGGNLRQLTDHPGDDRGPAWSPDGTRLAFVSDRGTGLLNDTEIYVMNADGTDPQRITEKRGMEWGVDWKSVDVAESEGSATTSNASVALFAGDGAHEGCVVPAEQMFTWMGHDVTLIDANTINQDDISGFDILYFPGGSTGPYQQDINADGRDKIRDLAQSGGCYIGTCAGALYAAEKVIWEGQDDSEGLLGLFPGTVEGPIPEIYEYPDIGMCQVNLETHSITEGGINPAWIMYYNGPYFDPNPGAEVDVIGRYEIGGEAAIVAFEYGEGRVVLTGPHPEWEEDSDRDNISYFDEFDDQGSDWDLMRNATLWCLGESSMTQAGETSPSTTTETVDDLQLTIVYDNYLQDERLTAEWGFAALVEYGEHVLLFDTGGSAVLLDNMQILGIDPKTIEAIVLSHEHWDHIGGLLDLLSEANQPTVYLLASFPSNFKNSVAARTQVIEVTSSMEIFPGIHTTGEVIGDVREQALAIKTEEGSVIITGCAHPGITRMVRRGRRTLQSDTEVYDPVALVIGGFHLGSASQSQIERIAADLQSLNVQQISPTHCTGDPAIALFSEIFGENFIPGGAGLVITIP